MRCIPFRDLIRKRRISFLHYNLNESQDSMLYKFLMCQMKNQKPKDWITQVMKDLQDLKIDLKVEDLKTMKKIQVKNTVE